MRELWYENGAPIIVSHQTPIDEIEPERVPARRIEMLRVVERVAATFARGNPKITALAWRFLLGAELNSMRKCAARAGCTAAAISHRASILAREFGLRQRDASTRERMRRGAVRAWKRKRESAACRMPCTDAGNWGGLDRRPPA